MVAQAQERSSSHPATMRLENRSVSDHSEESLKDTGGGFPGGTVVKNPPANAGDTGSSPGPGRSHMPRSN